MTGDPGPSSNEADSHTAAAEAAPGISPPLPVLIFDGDCGFCTSSARWLQRRLGLERAEPWQALDLPALGLTAREADQSVQFVRRDGRVFAGELAFAEVLTEVGGVWRAIGRMMRLPGARQLSGIVYRLVARNRHRLPGATDACRIQR